MTAVSINREFTNVSQEGLRQKALEQAEELRLQYAQIARLLEENGKLRIALVDARSYVDCVVANASGDKKRKNYLGCLSRIDHALKNLSE